MDVATLDTLGRPMAHTILLPLTGGRAADRSIDAALDHAEREGGVVHALYVVDTQRYGEPALSSAELLVDEAEDEGRRQLGQVAARGNARGITVEARCCHGRPADEIVDHALDVGADVVVLDRRLPHDRLVRLERAVDRVVRPDEAAVV
jgi:nucleotide-binding universal stress UspA family protein